MSSIIRPADFESARKWLSETFFSAAGAGLSRFPISFRYGDRESAAMLDGWTVRREAARQTEGFSVETILLTDPHTGLECRCEIKIYSDFPAVEWVAYLRNAGDSDTPIIADILPLDVLLPVDAGAPCKVHHARGSLAQVDDFAPLETPLTFRQGGSSLQLAARTGKSSTLNLPFFNLELGGRGVIGAIGWTGGWLANFQRQRDGVHVQAGMERTHLTLHPGEEIRTPRILLLFWEKDRIRGHNMLRRLILAHHTPRPNGELLRPPLCEGAWGARPEASHLAQIAWIRENNLPAECYWIDAGWYGDRPIEEAADGSGSGWMKQVGSWKPNSAAYPRGMRPIGEAAQDAGMGFLLWIEPERAHQDSEMFRTHPEWLLGPVHSGYLDTDNYMVNLGIPEARRHITELISGLITESRITCYRQDFNDLRVPELFGHADARDRIGMTEIRHIEGLYAFWDELLARHPGLIIDNCAGGGQRIDLETISRSVPLSRSDLQCWPFDPSSEQTQTQGLAPWVPLSCCGCVEPTAYAIRSALGAGMSTSWSSQAFEGGAHLPIKEIRRLMTEARAMRKYFYGDFYPLLTFSLAADAWAAWQFDRPDLGEGMVMAFRRHESPFSRWEAKLQGLDPESDYDLLSWDDQSTWRMTGKQFLEEGFAVTIAAKPGSALFTYQRVA
ncbi:MAG: alpha-galactosidase [Chloroflexi bacterium]|nr:alpha-galactosidase [Chloroflexota bacterium]